MPELKTAFIVISSILAIVNILPYIRDIYARKTKPRVVSWFNWSLLTAIASAASFSDHQWASAILTAISSVECMTVVVLGWRYGDRRIAPFDLACQAAAVAGMILWLTLDSPAIAIIATLSIDFVAGLPTMKHAWEAPHEETAITYFLGSVAAIFTILAAQDHRVTAIAFPIYLIIWNSLTALITYGRAHKLTESEQR